MARSSSGGALDSIAGEAKPLSSPLGEAEHRGLPTRSGELNNSSAVVNLRPDHPDISLDRYTDKSPAADVNQIRHDVVLLLHRLAITCSASLVAPASPPDMGLPIANPTCSPMLHLPLAATDSADLDLHR